MKYSIKTAKNGIKYVDIDTNQAIFEDKTLSEQNKIAKKYILDAFRNKDLLLNEEKINISSKSANEYTHPKNNLNKTAMSAKMKASTELDNLLEISTFEYSRADDGRHGIAKNGNTKTLYDITRIKKTSLVGLDETSSSTTRATSFSDNNISQNSKTVKLDTNV